jgi:hypothetical protein
VIVVVAPSLATSLAIANIEGVPTTPPTPTALGQRAAAGFVVPETLPLLGFALGVLVRSTGLPTGLALIWTLVVENLLRGVTLILPPLGDFTDLLPSTAADSMVGATAGPDAVASPPAYWVRSAAPARGPPRTRPGVGD